MISEWQKNKLSGLSLVDECTLCFINEKTSCSGVANKLLTSTEKDVFPTEEEGTIFMDKFLFEVRNNSNEKS